MEKIRENMNLLYTRIESNGQQIEKEICNKVLDYILNNAEQLQDEYNKENNDNIDVDFVELIEDSINLEIKYYYDNGYILTFEEWSNYQELLNNIKGEEC